MKQCPSSALARSALCRLFRHPCLPVVFLKAGVARSTRCTKMHQDALLGAGAHWVRKSLNPLGSWSKSVAAVHGNFLS